MTRVIFVSFLLMNSLLGFSQNIKKEASVEKSVFGIQVSLIGIWDHNELKLSDEIALRSEIGLSGINSSLIAPLIALEPR